MVERNGLGVRGDNRYVSPQDIYIPVCRRSQTRRNESLYFFCPCTTCTLRVIPSGSASIQTRPGLPAHNVLSAQYATLLPPNAGEARCMEEGAGRYQFVVRTNMQDAAGD